MVDILKRYPRYDMKKNFFILGMRRSGTSILKNLLDCHPDISAIEFEPHPLWNAIENVCFPRLKNSEIYSQAIVDSEKLISHFITMGIDEKWYGAKFAPNPGTRVLDWLRFPIIFPNLKFIFIIRNIDQTWASYKKIDGVTFNEPRGVLNETAYRATIEQIHKTFRNFEKKNSNRAVIINYKQLVLNADRELSKVWKLLGIKEINGLNKKMYRPENWGV